MSGSRHFEAASGSSGERIGWAFTRSYKSIRRSDSYLSGTWYKEAFLSGLLAKRRERACIRAVNQRASSDTAPFPWWQHRMLQEGGEDGVRIYAQTVKLAWGFRHKFDTLYSVERAGPEDRNDPCRPEHSRDVSG